MKNLIKNFKKYLIKNLKNSALSKNLIKSIKKYFIKSLIKTPKNGALSRNLFKSIKKYSIINLIQTLLYMGGGDFQICVSTVLSKLISKFRILVRKNSQVIFISAFFP